MSTTAWIIIGVIAAIIIIPILIMIPELRRYFRIRKM
jgi:hypothetical protein